MSARREIALARSRRVDGCCEEGRKIRVERELRKQLHGADYALASPVMPNDVSCAREQRAKTDPQDRVPVSSVWAIPNHLTWSNDTPATRVYDLHAAFGGSTGGTDEGVGAGGVVNVGVEPATAMSVPMTPAAWMIVTMILWLGAKSACPALYDANVAMPAVMKKDNFESSVAVPAPA